MTRRYPAIPVGRHATELPRPRADHRDVASRDHVIVERMHSTNPYTRMPPIGVQVVDREGAALVEAWIRQTSEETSR